MTRSKKELDAVEVMRAARDELSMKIEGMSLEEELDWLASQRIDDPFLQRLRERAARPANEVYRSSELRGAASMLAEDVSSDREPR